METLITGLDGTLVMFLIGGGVLSIAALLNKWHLDRLERQIARDETKGKP